jgi:hypothetical protein
VKKPNVKDFPVWKLVLRVDVDAWGLAESHLSVRAGNIQTVINRPTLKQGAEL